MKILYSPKVGFDGLKNSCKVDFNYGFLVFLLLLPLSLSIASAKGLTATMHLEVGMIGAIAVSKLQKRSLRIEGKILTAWKQ